LYEVSKPTYQYFSISIWLIESMPGLETFSGSTAKLSGLRDGFGRWGI
jgi:hypothetical protein